MAHTIKVRNQANNAWINLLQAQYIDTLDVDENFTATDVEGILKELFDTKAVSVEDTVDPGLSDSGYPVGTVWVNTTTDDVWICVDGSGTPEWVLLSQFNAGDIYSIVGGMVSGNTETNIDVTYDDIGFKLNFNVNTATPSILGVASFDDDKFDVVSGHVTMGLNSIGEYELESGIDATSIGFDADKVDGRDVDDSITTVNNLWTALKIQSHTDTELNNLSWQEPVISRDIITPPSSAAIEGDRYVVPVGSLGDWSGQDNQIAEWNGSYWDFTDVNKSGYVTWVLLEETWIIYYQSSWSRMAQALSHSDLSELDSDDHTQYVHNDISRIITAQHTFSTSGSPFILDENTQTHLVTGLNADLLNGQDWTVSETSPSASIDNDIWVEITS